MHLKETKLARTCLQNNFGAQMLVMFFGGLHSSLHFRCELIRATIERYRAHVFQKVASRVGVP